MMVERKHFPVGGAANCEPGYQLFMVADVAHGWMDGWHVGVDTEYEDTMSHANAHHKAPTMTAHWITKLIKLLHPLPYRMSFWGWHGRHTNGIMAVLRRLITAGLESA